MRGINPWRTCIASCCCTAIKSCVEPLRLTCQSIRSLSVLIASSVIKRLFSCLLKCPVKIVAT